MVGKRDNMLNKKGQALIEFVMILPVFLMLVFGAIDFGKIIYEKYTLQNKLDIIVNLYKDGNTDKMNSYIKDNDIDFKETRSDGFVTLTATKKVKITTPGVNAVLTNPYNVEESIVIVDETE